MNITVLNEKGGVGKTTVALLLASAMRSAGMEVAVEDCCLDKTATDWCIRVGNVPLTHEVGQVDHTVLDTPSGLTQLPIKYQRKIIETLNVSDRILVPIIGSIFEQQSLLNTFQFIREHGKADARVMVIFNQVPARSQKIEQWDRAYFEEFSFQLVNTAIPFSQTYSRFAESGWTQVTGEHRIHLTNVLFELDV